MYKMVTNNKSTFITFLIMVLKITKCKKEKKKKRRDDSITLGKKACHSIKNNNATELNYFRKELTKEEKFKS